MKTENKETVNNVHNEDNESVNQVNSSDNSKKVYVNVKLRYGLRTVKCRALVDTGNTVTARSVITKKLHNDIQSGFSALGGKVISTAKSGSGLKRIGRSNEIEMEIDGLTRKFQIKPTVVEDLSDDLNLGNGFLAELGEKLPCAIIYRGKATKLKVGKEEVELIRTLSQGAAGQSCKAGSRTSEGQEAPPNVLTVQANSAVLEPRQIQAPDRNVDPGVANGSKRSKSKVEQCGSRLEAQTGTESGAQKELVDKRESRGQKVQGRLHKQSQREQEPERVRHVYCAQDLKVKKNTLTFVPAYLAKPMDKGKDILVEPLGNGSKTVAAVYNWKETGKIAVINPYEWDLTIKKGSKLGKYSEIEIIKSKPDEEKLREMKEHKPDVAEILKKLRIEENEILKKNPVIKGKLIELVSGYADVFCDPEGVQIGTTSLIEFDVELKEGSKPVRQRLRPLNPKQRESLRKQLDLWIKEEVVEESNSPWASPLVPAKKKGGDGNAIRWAVDYRMVNSMTVGDAWPIPSIEENLEKLQGARYFSAIDASAAYHTIPVNEKSRPYLAFLTPWGTYQYKKMPFGAKNAGQCYSRLVELSIMKLRSKNILAYIDDIICCTQDLLEHLKELEDIFRMHREAGIKIRAEKTHLIRPEVEYLGYDVSEEGVKMRTSYVEKITQWPTPKTVKELNCFLGFCGYYRTFIANFSKLTNEMNSMRKETKLVWNEELEKNFNLLKEEFSKMPVRSYPDYSSDEPFQLALDFSKDNVAAILSQVQDGQERFIAAAGRKTTKYERNYHSCKGELAAIIYGLRKFEHILKFRKFTLWTDSKALTYLQTMKKLTGIYFRWLSEIQSFDFDVYHRPGKENTNADALSRSNHLELPTREEEEEEAGYVHKLYTLVKKLEKNDEKIRNLHRNSDKLTKDNIVREQKDDEILGQVRKWIKQNKLPSKQELKDQPEELKVYYQNFEALQMEKGVLYRMRQCNDPTGKVVHQICVPDKLQGIVHEWSHAHPTSGHFGIRATLLRTGERFYYPGMKKDSETRVKACPECLAKIQRAKVRDATHQPRRTGYVGELLFVDLVGPMPVTRDQHKYILTIEDAYSRYVMAVPIPNKEAATVTRHLMDRYVSVFGTPTAIHSDQGKEFTAEIFKDLMDKLQVKRTTTPTYNPQSNGNLERFHRTLNTLIRIFCDREDPEWERYLPSATLAYNTKQHSSTGITPYSGMFGRECRLPIDLIIPTPDDKSKDINVHVRETLDRFKKMYNHVRNKNNAVIRRNAQLYSGKTNHIGIGTRVWYLAPRKIKGKPVKITDQWIGPFKVISKPTAVLVEISPADYNGPTIVTHMARIIPCSNVQTTKQRIPNRIQLDDQGDELAEEIMAPDNIEEPRELGVPVRFVQQPDYEMVDISRGGQNARPETATASPNQIEPVNVNEPGPSKQPHISMDTRDKDRGTKRPKRVSDSEVEERKHPRLRPRRTKEQLQADNEKKRKREMEQPAEESDEQQMRPEQPFPLLPSGMAQYLPSDTTGDSDAINAVHTLEVDVAAGSDVPARSTPGSAAYDVKAYQTIVVPPNSTGLVPLNLRLATPDDHFMYLMSRSGLALKGITIEGGVIDPDYHQEVKAIIRNTTSHPFKVQKGQRIAQAIFLPIVKAKFNLVDRLRNEDEPSHPGFGSTGDQ